MLRRIGLKFWMQYFQKSSSVYKYEGSEKIFYTFIFLNNYKSNNILYYNVIISVCHYTDNIYKMMQKCNFIYTLTIIF